jgi:epidermal growth factor receptor substrate 15
MSTFNPTPSEIALTSQIFTLADPQNVGIVTGDIAVKILTGASLSHAVLGEIWGIADKDNNGFLTKKGVAIALRLIGYAQKGESVTEALLDKRK